MKNFNWEEFKKGNIAVHCDTEAKAKDFLEKCDKEGIRWRYRNERTITEGSNCWRVEKENTSYSCMGGFCTLGYSNYKSHRNKGLKIIKWEIEDMKELTFTEVIATIKEGQVWRNRRLTRNLKEISKKGGVIDFIFVDTDRSVLSVCEEDTFILHRKEYTFQEAFKAYEEGKEIEDCNGTKYKKIDNEDHCKGEYDERFCSKSCEYDYWFGFDEIRGAWYIND